MKKVIELIRVSTEGQAASDRGGIPAQREVNRRTAAAHGLDIVRSIEIVDVSGSAVLRSPEMLTLLELMTDPEIIGVVTKEFSRLMRPDDFSDYILLQRFIETGTLLYLPDGPIDLCSKSGRFLGTIRAAMAGLERSEILERMRDGKEALRRAGKCASGYITLPFGVAYSREKGWSYTAEAEKVKLAFSLFLSGAASYTEISRQLNWPRSNLRFVLMNRIYTGWRVYDEMRDPSAQGYYSSRPGGRQSERRKIKRPVAERIEVRVLEGLISEEDFARVQKLIAVKRERHWRVRKDTGSRYTYNGFVNCGDPSCRSLIYTHSSKHDFYVCKSRHPRERKKRALLGLSPCNNRYMLKTKLEAKIDHLIGRKLTEAEFVAELVAAYNAGLEAPSSRITIDEGKVRKMLESLAAKRDRVLEAFFEGAINRQERDRKLADVEGETRSYNDLLDNIAGADQCCSALDLRTVEALVEPFFQWEFLAREDKRQLLRHLCPEIAIYQYRITGITLNLPVPESGCNKDSRPKTAWFRSPAPQ